MDRQAAMARLPETYRRVAEWRDRGGDVHEIAAQLGIEAEAVPALVQLADAKLTALLDGDGDGDRAVRA